jgi:hypothetical protein
MSFPITGLDALIRNAKRIHAAGISAGFSSDGTPALPPTLLVLWALDGKHYTEIVPVPSHHYKDHSPASVIDSLTPVARPKANDFFGVIFTFEAWYVTADRKDDARAKDLLVIAQRREIYKQPDRKSVRTTMAIDVDDNWVLLVEAEGDPAAEIFTSASAEENTDHMQMFATSSVAHSLRGLVGRIEASIEDA